MGLAKATAWRFMLAYNGNSISEGPVTRAQMFALLKQITGTMDGATNGRAKISISCSLLR
jgi:hypothetical protein